MEADILALEDHEIINGRKVVKKHVAAIHCTNKLTLLERKISNALLYHAFPTLKDELTHEIQIDQLKSLLGINTRNHKALKDALTKLISTVLEWNLCGDDLGDEDLEGWNASTILSSVSVNKGTIKYQYSELIKSLLSNPSMYGKINLAIQSRFKSAYALALYENCSRYRGLPSTKTFEMPLFRSLMGVKEGAYKKFYEFNKRVLNPAVTEINSRSDIRVYPSLVKRGNRVIAIKFKLEERNIMKRLGIAPLGQGEAKKPTLNINDVATEFSVKTSTLKKLIAEHGELKVKDAIEYVKSRPQYQAGQINNLAGYLHSAIVNEYKEQPLTERKRISSAVLEAKDKELEQSMYIESMRIPYRHYVAKAVMGWYLKNTKLHSKAMIDDFFKSASYVGRMSQQYYLKLKEKFTSLVAAIEKGDFNALALFESGFADYLIAHHTQLMNGVYSSFEKYLECYSKEV